MRQGPWGLVVAGLVYSPGLFAHAGIKGTNEFVAGLLHPVIVLPHLLVLLGLGIVLGQQGRARVREGVPLLVTGVVAGLLAPLVPEAGGLELMLLVAAVLAGAGAAWAGRLARAGVLAFSAGAGLLIGLDSAIDGLTGWRAVVADVGIVAAVGLVTIWCAGLAITLQRPWQQTGLRVLGSWIVAAAMLNLALAARLS